MGSQARILYSDQKGRVCIALAINKAVADGRVSVRKHLLPRWLFHRNCIPHCITFWVESLRWLMLLLFPRPLSLSAETTTTLAAQTAPSGKPRMCMMDLHSVQVCHMINITHYRMFTCQWAIFHIGQPIDNIWKGRHNLAHQMELDLSHIYCTSGKEPIYSTWKENLEGGWTTPLPITFKWNDQMCYCHNGS